MRVLVTGICGFVGSVIAESWLNSQEGLSVIGVDNLIRPGSELNRRHLQRLGVRLYHGDIRMASDFEALPPVDWVIDASANSSVLAGVDGMTSSRQLVEHNLLGTVNILEYCKRHAAGFILISTSRVYSIPPLARVPVEQNGARFCLRQGEALPYGISEAGINEEFSCAPPVSLYGSTKLASEQLALEYGETFGFPAWINRCGVMAGAGQFGRPDQGIFSYWINSWMRNRPLTYTGFGGTGCQVRDCLHPRDVVPLLMRQTSCENFSVPRIVNIGGGGRNSMSLLELSQWCTGHIHRHNVESNPANRPFDLPWIIMDSAQAGTLWDWQPQTTLDEILAEIARHAEQHPEWLELSGIS